MLLNGGTGDDYVWFHGPSRYLDTVILIGGTGADQIIVRGGRTVSIDAGSENDHVEIDTLGGSYTIALGSGSDILELTRPYSSFAAGNSIVVTDFETGASGDRLEIQSYLGDALQGWNPDTNPFGEGYLHLVQVGTSTLLQIDRDGGGGYATLLTFENTSIAEFTAENLGGYMPGQTITGSSQDDHLTGTSASDVLYGAGGNDLLAGGAGADKLFGGTGVDTMFGGTGSDSYYVDSRFDRVVEGAGAGLDRVYTSATFTLSDHVEELRMTGSANINGTGNAIANRIIGNDGNNWLVGREGNDVIGGGAGADKIDGGDGVDWMFGGAGRDTFILQDGWDSDRILDFEAGLLADRMDLRAVTAITSYADLTANHLVSNSAGDAVIAGGGGNFITLQSIAVADLTSDNFIF